MQARRSLPEVIDDAASMLSKFVVPLYQDDIRGRPAAFATCFIVNWRSQYFVISAAHVLETLRTRSLYYYITPRVTRKLTGRLVLNHWDGDRENDPIDIGVLKLEGDALPPYPEVSKFPIDISYFHPDSLPRSDKHYVVIGFPASRGKLNPVGRTVEVTGYAYRTNSIHDDEYSAHGLSPRDHLLLPLNLKKGFVSSGQHRNFPKPNGMSGSPIWILFDEGGGEQPRVFPVVAVATKYWRSKGLIVATDIRIVLEMIERAA